MALLSEIVYHLQNLRSKGIQSDDTKLSDDQVMFMIDQYRVKLLSQVIARTKGPNPDDLQDLGYLEVEPCPVDEMPLVGGFDMFQTVKKLPRMSHYSFVGRSPIDKSFQRTSLTKLPWDRVSKYTRAEPKWFHMDGRLYIATEQPIREIWTMGIAESPIKVVEFKGELDYTDPHNFEYPLSMGMLDTLYKMIADAEFKILGYGLDDRKNDGNETTREQQ